MVERKRSINPVIRRIGWPSIATNSNTTNKGFDEADATKISKDDPYPVPKGWIEFKPNEKTQKIVHKLQSK